MPQSWPARPARLPHPDPLITLAVLAAVTERIRLQTEVLLAPLHRPALLAKQCAALPPKYLDRLFRKVEQAWAAEGRAGQPRLVAQTKVAIGPPTMIDEARRELRAYYGDTDYTEHAVEGCSPRPSRSTRRLPRSPTSAPAR
jgi:alkanesulfonate monooxygenase SsuD/methylene tetrahydromethanopterin reductase-like flavin-dependent oxidoreductase (luciferase family)